MLGIRLLACRAQRAAPAPVYALEAGRQGAVAIVGRQAPCRHPVAGLAEPGDRVDDRGLISLGLRVRGPLLRDERRAQPGERVLRDLLGEASDEAVERLDEHLRVAHTGQPPAVIAERGVLAPVA